MHALLHWLFSGHARDLSLGKRLAHPPIALLVGVSQLFWLVAAWRWLARRARWPLRLALAAAAAAWYAGAFALTFTLLPHQRSPVRLTLAQALLAAPFQVWLLGSVGAFLLIALYWLGARAVRLWSRPRRAAVAAAADAAAVAPAPVNPARREFLRQAGRAAVAVPFAAGAYGVLHGRVEFETTHPRIALAKLPAAFHGFRIAQLSDIHIGPFMTEREVRRVVQMVNALRPDLVVLTGDFVTWDPTTQQAAVAALAGLRAPFGVYGCLGNHELYTRTQRSITRLFHQANVTILRQAGAMVRVPGVGGAGTPAQFQLLGVDFIPRKRQTFEDYVRVSVPQVANLMIPGMVNLLLAHSPNCFYRAAEIGMDLTISGHTHGGQICCVTPELSPGRLVSAYVAGHYRRGAAQLYVNRGLGTIALPMRLFAPPEITVFELAARI